MNPAVPTGHPDDGVDVLHPEADVMVRRPTEKRFSTKRKLKYLVKRIGRGAEALAGQILRRLPLPRDRRPVAEVRVGERTVRAYRHWPADQQLLADWDALSRTAPGATVFQSPAWMQGASLGPDALGTLRLLTVYDGRQLLAAIPLERRWGGRWRSVDIIATAYHDPLFHPDHAAQAWDAIVSALPQIDRKFRSLTFQRLSPGAAAIAPATAAAQRVGWRVADEPTDITNTVIPLAASWDEYLARLHRDHRQKLRRRLRRVEETGQMRFVINDRPETVAAALPSLLDLMQRTAGGKGRKTRWVYRPQLAVSVPPLAASGRFVVYQLFIEGKLAAANISMPQGDVPIMWNGAMDDSMRDWSPGIVLWALMLQHAIEQGKSAVDLLTGLMVYKHELGAVERTVHRLTITKAHG